MTEKEVKDIVGQFGIECTKVGECIDTSHGEKDKRYVYLINDNEYVLKVTNVPFKEAFFKGIADLVDRYIKIGVYAPNLIKADFGYVYKYKKEETYNAYMEEYAKYPLYSKEGDIDYEFKKEILRHVGRLAAYYSNMDLVNHYSMWSVVQLGAMDENIDEKQENMNQLVSCLRKHEYTTIADKLEKTNSKYRKIIKDNFDLLPKCVYQGDLNPSNILVDENGNFKGIIDFNLYGTEVNINCFTCESMYYLRENDINTLSANELFEKMNHVWQELMDVILSEYTMNNLEKECLIAYKVITFMSFYPNVELMCHCLEESKNALKIIDLLHLIADMK